LQTSKKIRVVTEIDEALGNASKTNAPLANSVTVCLSVAIAVAPGMKEVCAIFDCQSF
jgi:hypothetical protein